MNQVSFALGTIHVNGFTGTYTDLLHMIDNACMVAYKYDGMYTAVNYNDIVGMCTQLLLM
jgi:hypothetical protein